MPRPRRDSDSRRDVCECLSRFSHRSLIDRSIATGRSLSLLYHLFRANSCLLSTRQPHRALSSPFLLATVSSFSVREMYKPQRGSAHRKSQSSPAGFFCTWRSKGGR